MTVKDLIEKLVEFDESLEVLIYSYDDQGSMLYSPEEIKIELTTKLSNEKGVPHTQENCITIGQSEL